MNIKKIFLFLLLFLSIFNITESSDFKVIKPEIKIEEQDVIKEEIVFLNFFERKNCIHCKSELTFLENLENQSFYLNRLDLDDKNNLELFNQIINKYGLSAATPLNLIGDLSADKTICF